MRELVYITDPESSSFGYIVTKPENNSNDFIAATYENCQALQKVFPWKTFAKIDRAIERLEYFKSRLEKSTEPKFQSICVIEETPETGYVEAKFNHLKVVIRVNNPLAFWEILDGDKEIRKGELIDIKDFIREHLKDFNKKHLKETFEKFRDFFEKSDYFTMRVIPYDKGNHFLRVLNKETDKIAWGILLKYDEGPRIIIDGVDVSNNPLDEILNDFHNPYHIARFALAKNFKPSTKHKDTQLIYDDLGNRIGYMRRDDLGTLVTIKVGRGESRHFTDYEELKAFIRSKADISYKDLVRLSDTYRDVIKMMFPYNVNFNDIVTSNEHLRVRKFDLTNPSQPPATLEIVDDFNENKITFVVDGKTYNKLEHALKAIRRFVEIE